MASLSNLLLITEDQEDGKQAPSASQHNSPCGIKQCLEMCWKHQEPSVAAFGLVSPPPSHSYLGAINSKCAIFAAVVIQKTSYHNKARCYSQQLRVKNMMFICICVHASMRACVRVCVYMQVLHKPIIHGVGRSITDKYKSFVSFLQEICRLVPQLEDTEF